MESDLDPALVRAWLEARSIARGLPPPVDDHDGYRVDTCSSSEVARWVFPMINPGLVELGRSLTEPRHLIKLCGDIDELCSVLPERWRPHPLGYFMKHVEPIPQSFAPDGYAGEVRSDGCRTNARIIRDGKAVATGYAAETEHLFIYDRIETDPLHRRKGLAKAVMSLLKTAKTKSNLPEVLVATEERRNLYEALGWRTMSAYSLRRSPTQQPNVCFGWKADIRETRMS
jgi:GNAT superfamily N-acetyltransferase